MGSSVFAYIVFAIPTVVFGAMFVVEFWQGRKRNKRIKEVVTRDKWEVDHD